MARIDLGNGDSGDELADALRQLEKQQQRSGKAEARGSADADTGKRRAEREREAGHRQSQADVQDAVAAIRKRQETEQRAAARRRVPSRAKWVVLGVVVAAALAVVLVLLRPTPLPPPATSAQGAARGFWQALIEGNYEGATVYYPGLVERYGSRKQAGLFLAKTFRDDPPTHLSLVGEPEPLPDTADQRVSYEVWRRSGRPRTGEFVVRGTPGDPGGYAIVTGL